MEIFVSDSQVVPELEATLFTLLQQGPVDSLFMLRNAGTVTMNYRFQEWNGTAWVDLSALGTDANNTLSSNQVKTLKLSSNYPKVQLVGNASGGSILEFSITRFFSRMNGGDVPILSL